MRPSWVSGSKVEKLSRQGREWGACLMELWEKRCSGAILWGTSARGLLEEAGNDEKNGKEYMKVTGKSF